MVSSFGMRTHLGSQIRGEQDEEVGHSPTRSDDKQWLRFEVFKMAVEKDGDENETVVEDVGVDHDEGQVW